MAPFSCSYSPQVPELLLNLNCTIALTTYQAGKIVFLSPNPDKERLASLPRTFEKPMGIAVKGDKMLIAAKDEVILLENSRDLATHYPSKPNTYDSLWLPRITFHTGQVDMHDILRPGGGRTSYVLDRGRRYRRIDGNRAFGRCGGAEEC